MFLYKLVGREYDRERTVGAWVIGKREMKWKVYSQV